METRRTRDNDTSTAAVKVEGSLPIHMIPEKFHECFRVPTNKCGFRASRERSGSFFCCRRITFVFDSVVPWNGIAVDPNAGSKPRLKTGVRY
jgi:hypothetical protein